MWQTHTENMKVVSSFFPIEKKGAEVGEPNLSFIAKTEKGGGGRGVYWLYRCLVVVMHEESGNEVV